MRPLSSAMLLAVMLGCGKSAEVTQPEQAVPSALADRMPAAQYTLIKYTSSLGGTISRGNGINDFGWIAGYSNEPGNTTRHAAMWRSDNVIDLGTLGGPNSNVAWPGINNLGMAAGIAEKTEMDPNNEDWSCSSFFPTTTHHICRAFVWQSGRMKELLPLGGNNGFGTGVNDEGQVVGWAETAIHDPTCNAPQVLQFRAVRWDARTGAAHELPPLHGDSTSAATAINDRGQVVGISGACDVAVGEFSAAHAVMWENGRVRDIGSLGGVAWNTPMDINIEGDAVGFSDPPGDADGSFLAHAVFWPHNGRIQQLAELPGDQTSQALGINARGQIVGESCNTTCTAVIWQNGSPIDLNKLMGPGYVDHMSSAQHINDFGVITGRVLDKATGKTLPFIATPNLGRR